MNEAEERVSALVSLNAALSGVKGRNFGPPVRSRLEQVEQLIETSDGESGGGQRHRQIFDASRQEFENMMADNGDANDEVIEAVISPADATEPQPVTAAEAANGQAPASRILYRDVARKRRTVRSIVADQLTEQKKFNEEMIRYTKKIYDAEKISEKNCITSKR